MLQELQSYILNEDNITTYLKYKLPTKEKGKDKTFNREKRVAPKVSLFIPKETDTLFWCYYVIKNGEIAYEMLQSKNYLVTKQLKIECVLKIRENKMTLKQYKIDSLANIESNLTNDDIINSNTFMALCLIENINIIFVRKNMYYELSINDDITYIIRENDGPSKYVKKYGYELGTNETIEQIKATLYKVDSLSKPFKSLTSYKLDDLIEIATKFNIDLKKENGSKKTKNELYENIMQSL